MNEVMLRARGVVKTFPARPAPVRALDGVDLDIAPGALTAILGPSGCGKTTLLRILAGFEHLDDGEVRFGERVLSARGSHVPPQRRGIGIVPQEGALFPHLDVARNIGFGLGAGWDRARRRQRVAELLDLVGLAGYERRRPDELSGGQQQRIALARALAPGPDVVLLDEPFSAIDAGMRAELREEVRELLRRVGATAVLVTHDQTEALSLADQVAVMRAGRVVQVGTPEQVYQAPADREIASFVGEAVLLPATVVDVEGGTAWADCALGRVQVRCDAEPGQTCLAMLRPEQVELCDVGVPATVVGTTYYGHDALVRVRLGAETIAIRTSGRGVPPAGATVCVRVLGEARVFGSG